MICFKDMTFCSAECANHQCPRNFTPDQKVQARNWWGGDDVPVAFADFKTGCEDFIEPRRTGEGEG